VGNPFDGKASASTAGVGGRLISLGTVNLPPSAVAEYAMTGVSDCTDVLVMAQGSNYTDAGLTLDALSSPDGTTRVSVSLGSTTNPVDGVPTASIMTSGRFRYLQPRVSNNSHTIGTDVTAWIWCATSPSYAVGGIAELPALAGPAGGSGMGRATYAVLAGAAAGVLAFAVLATLSVKRWGVR
jgi:hypothetical protein